MNEIIRQIEQWLQRKHNVCLAWVVKTYGSSPNKIGSLMAFRDDQVFIGSVSSGCLEGEIIEEGLKLPPQNSSAIIKTYGVSDQKAWEVGLACGGKITILIETLNIEKLNILKEAQKLQSQRQSSYLCFNQSNGLAKLQKNCEGNFYFCHKVQPKNRLLIVGASHIAQELYKLADLFDYESVIIDKRSKWANLARFPNAKIEIDWPDQVLKNYLPDHHASLVCLAHDNKIDNPAIAYAIKNDCRYIGALGSISTKEKREADLMSNYDLSPNDLKKIHAPIGLDIKAKEPKEIALAIFAQIIFINNTIATNFQTS